MEPNQVPHYFQCNKFQTKCGKTCRDRFLCKKMTGPDPQNPTATITTWACKTEGLMSKWGIPSNSYLLQAKGDYYQCIDNCSEAAHKCIIEKTHKISYYWQPKPKEIVHEKAKVDFFNKDKIDNTVLAITTGKSTEVTKKS